MLYRAIGSTDLQASEIGFGTAATSGLMTRGELTDQRKIVVRALELGINYFDTAPDYGDGVAEANLGSLLRELGVRPIITTKVEVRKENLDDIAGHVERSVNESLSRLQVDYLDVVQLHNGPTITRPEIEGRVYRVLGIEDYLATNGALEGLERVRRKGKTRFLGFVVRGDDREPVRQLIDTGLFHILNVPYTLLNPTAGMERPYRMDTEPDYGDVISYAKSKGVGTAIYSPLAAGLLTDQIAGGGSYHPLSRSYSAREPDVRRAQALRFLSGDSHSLAQAAYQFILMNSGVTTAISGVSDIVQLEEVVKTSGAGPLSSENMARIESVWRFR